MIRFSDYLYALVPSVCLAVPFALFAQWVPDVEFLHGLERLGIVGFLAAGILFFVMERRSFIDQSVRKLALLERRISNLEANVSSGNDKVVSLLGQQLDALREIKEAQAENFARMWQLTLDRLGADRKQEAGGRRQDATDGEL